MPQCYSLAYKVVSGKDDETLPEGLSETDLSPENGLLTVRPTKTDQPAEFEFFVAVESDRELVGVYGPFFLYLVEGNEDMS